MLFTEKQEELLLLFDQISCGLEIEEIIKAAALLILYNNDYSIMSNAYINYWEQTYFRMHVDNDSRDSVHGMTLEVFNMFLGKLNVLLNFPYLFGTGRDMEVDFDYKLNNATLRWSLHGAYDNPGV